MTTHLTHSRADRCTDCQGGQGRVCACRGEAVGRRPEQRSCSPWSPTVNVLLLLALFAAVKLKLVVAAVVLGGLVGYAAWRVVA